MTTDTLRAALTQSDLRCFLYEVWKVATASTAGLSNERATICPTTEWADRIIADAFQTLGLTFAAHPESVDARRYRWLRERYTVLCRMECARALGLDLSRVFVNTVEKFDAIVDAAIAKGSQDEHR